MNSHRENAEEAPAPEPSQKADELPSDSQSGEVPAAVREAIREAVRGTENRLAAALDDVLGQDRMIYNGNFEALQIITFVLRDVLIGLIAVLGETGHLDAKELEGLGHKGSTHIATATPEAAALVDYHHFLAFRPSPIRGEEESHMGSPEEPPIKVFGG